MTIWQTSYCKRFFCCKTKKYKVDLEQNLLLLGSATECNKNQATAQKRKVNFPKKKSKMWERA
jgi:hypothetical protein